MTLFATFQAALEGSNALQAGDPLVVGVSGGAALTSVFLGAGMAYAFASFYVLTIPITGAFFAKRNWLLGKRYGFITPGDMYAYYFNNEALRWLERRDPSCPFFLVVSFLAAHPPLVPPAVKGSGEPSTDDLPGQLGANHAASQDQQIGIVMSSAHDRRGNVGTEGGADP